MKGKKSPELIAIFGISCRPCAFRHWVLMQILVVDLPAVRFSLQGELAHVSVQELFELFVFRAGCGLLAVCLAPAAVAALI